MNESPQIKMAYDLGTRHAQLMLARTARKTTITQMEASRMAREDVDTLLYHFGEIDQGMMAAYRLAFLQQAWHPIS